MIRITSRRDGYIRSGHRHPRRADYADGHFSADELACFDKDPVLTVTKIPATSGVVPPGGYMPAPAPPTPRDEPSGTDAAPLPGPDPVAAAIEAMLAEDPDRQRADWWTRTGKPELRELRRRGVDVTAAERNAALEAMGRD